MRVWMRVWKGFGEIDMQQYLPTNLQSSDCSIVLLSVLQTLLVPDNAPFDNDLILYCQSSSISTT